MAAQFKKSFVQDLTQDIQVRQCGTIVFNKDDLSNVLEVALYNGQTPYADGGTVSGACICPDGATVPLNGSLTGNVARVTLIGDCFAIPGQIGVGIQITSGTSKTTVLKAIYNVELLETETIVDPGSRITLSISDLVDDIADAVATIPADYSELLATVAPTFSSSNLYVAGQFVWYDAALYVFTAEHKAGAWTGTPPTDAAAVTIGDVVTDVNRTAQTHGFCLDALSGTATSYTPTPLWINNSKVAYGTGVISSGSKYRRTDYLPTYGGESITVSAAPTNMVFYDANRAYVSGTQTFPANLTVTVPANAYYFMICLAPAKDVPTITINNAKPFRQQVNATIEQNSLTLVNTIGAAAVKGVQWPGNLVNPMKCIDNTYVKTSDGLEQAGATYFCTDFIPVTAGSTYKANYGRNAVWYKSDKTFLSAVTGTGIQTGLNAPQSGVDGATDDAAYLRLTVNKAADKDNISNPALLYLALSSEYDTSATIPGLRWVPGFAWCAGKTINWCGDSIVDGEDFDEYVCSALNLTKLTTDGVNGGINGSSIAERYNTTSTTDRHPICDRYSDMPTGADIVVISAGTNDWMYAYSPVGSMDSTDKTSFYGALKALCEGLITRYPQALIAFTTPIKRAQAFENGNGGTYTADGVMTTPFSKNKYGYTLMDYADIIKEVCGYYSIPVLDMYRESGLNPHIAAQQDMFDNILTHPNATGQRVMARRVAGWLASVGYGIE